jgi:hypothetical protein
LDVTADESDADPSDGQVSLSDTQSESDTGEQSIEDMLLEFDDEEGLIRDRSLLDPNYVVEEDRIVGRDEQLEQVVEMLRVAIGGNRPPNLFLYGPSGTGKSLITRAVCNKISHICATRDVRFGTIEVNCQDLDTLGVAVYRETGRVPRGRTEIEDFRDERWTPSTEPASGRCPRAADERLGLSTNHSKYGNEDLISFAGRWFGNATPLKTRYWR